MHDQLVPLDLFFSTASSTTVRSNYGSVNTPKIRIDRSDINVSCPQAIQDSVKRAVVVPGIEKSVDRSPRTEFVLRQVTPRRTRSQYPQDRVDHQARICGRSARLGWRRKKVRDQFPLVIRQSMSSHLAALLGRKEPPHRPGCGNSLTLPKTSKPRNSSFQTEPRAGRSRSVKRCDPDFFRGGSGTWGIDSFDESPNCRCCTCSIPKQFGRGRHGRFRKFFTRR